MPASTLRTSRDARVFEFSRRGVLLSIVGAVTIACHRLPDPSKSSTDLDVPLSARFAYPDSKAVQLDYLDHQNFRLSDSAQFLDTLAIAGSIYLHNRKAADGGVALWRFGDLKTPQPDRASLSRLKFRPTLIPQQGIAHWDIKVPVFDVAFGGELTPPQLDATVAKIPALAHAQFTIGASLLPAMNMSLCGNIVQQVTRSWNTSLTGEDWAVLATSDGFRLDGPVERLRQTPVLPQGVIAREFPLP